jgi:IclR family transcriptional regulator, acetate operon repressor
MENQVPPYPVQSVDHVLQLLLTLKRDGLLRVSDAAAELGVAKSTARPLISMLRFRGFVEQASDRTYRVGSALADLGGGGLSSTTALLGIARPHLARLTEIVGESSNLIVRVGADVQFIDAVETSTALRVGSRVGVRLAARLCSGGKVLLADLPFEEVGLLPSRRTSHRDHPRDIDARGPAATSSASDSRVLCRRTRGRVRATGPVRGRPNACGG